MLTLTQSQRLRYSSFFYLYIMQGIPSGFALTALTNYLAAEGLTAQAIANFGAIVGLPWGVKFIWGPIVDRFQGSAMGRRRPWVLFAQVMAFIASLGLLLTSNPVTDFNVLTVAFVVHGVFASLQDVSVDALAITVTPSLERGRVNALMKGGMITGQAIGAAGLAVLLRYSGFQSAALVQSGILLVLTVVTFFVRERPEDALFSLRSTGWRADTRVDASFRSLLSELVRALLAPQNLLLFGAIALVFIAERLFQRVFFLHLIQQLGWSDTSVSVLSGTYGTVVAIVLALAGGWLSDRVGAQRMLLGVAFFMGVLHVGFSAIEPLWANQGVATAGIVVRQTLEPIFSIAALPVLMGLCRRGVAGAQFAFYMALSNQADVLGIYLSGVLLSHFSAPVVGLCCGLAMLTATMLIGLVYNRARGHFPINELS